MDLGIKNAILETLSIVRSNLTDSHGGRWPVAKVTDAAVSALGAWEAAGKAAERHYLAMARLSERADDQARKAARAARADS